MEPSSNDRPPLRIRFEIPRSEIDRAADTLARVAALRAPMPPDFDVAQLRGKVVFEINAPFADDPILSNLRQRGIVGAEAVNEISLRQPVAYVIGQLASALILVGRGEGEFTIRLTGGKGAITVAAEGEVIHLGVPLDAYAGVAAVPTEAAERAVVRGCAALQTVLTSRPEFGSWRFVRFLERARAILEAGSSPGAPPCGWNPASFLEGAATSLPETASTLEGEGAHVVPYWRAERRSARSELEFDPMRTPGRPERLGALAFCITPRGDRLLEVRLPDDPAGEAKLRARLRKRKAFTAAFEGGRLARLVEATSELPMA